MEIDIYSRIPIYQQIIDEYKREMILGMIHDGDQIRSVRELSQELHTNPNTIQKAYTELERQKLIMTAPGKGSFISQNATSLLAQITITEEKIRLQQSIERLARFRISEEEIIQLVENTFQAIQAKEENL